MGQNYTDSSRGVLRSVNGQDYTFTPTYLRKRDPINPPASPDVKPKEQQGYYPVNSLWTNTTNHNVWLLTGIVNNLGKWVLISSGGIGPTVKVGVPLGTSPITPDMNGLINFTSTGGTLQITGSAGGLGNQNINFDLTGGAVAIEKIQGDDGVNVVPTAGIVKLFGNVIASATHAKPVFFLEKSATTDTEQLDIQLTTTSTPVSKNINNVGLASFDSNSFTVDAATGFVQLIGSASAIEKINVDAATAPGTNPVVPSLGAITVTGAQVAAGIIGAHAIRTNSLAANTYTVEIQRANSNSIAGSTVNDAGIASYLNEDFNLDINGQVSLANRILTGSIGSNLNLGIHYASPTFTILGADNTNLSATNPAWVVVPSQTVAGKNLLFKITANYSFQDSTGVSNISGNTFGTTAATAWSEFMPFYIYAVVKTDDTAFTFMISRVPHLSQSPVAGKIAKSGSAVASTQGSMFALDSAITVANYASSALTCIGSFRMTKTAGDDWTVFALSNVDGIGKFNNDIFFNFPKTQNGATSNFMSSSVGGDTIPTLPVNAAASYTINKDGKVTYTISSDSVSVNGVGGGNLRVHLPLNTAYSSTNTKLISNISWKNSGAGTFSNMLAYLGNVSNLYYTEFIPCGTGVAKITPGTVTTDKAELGFEFSYVTSNI